MKTIFVDDRGGSGCYLNFELDDGMVTIWTEEGEFIVTPISVFHELYSRYHKDEWEDA